MTIDIINYNEAQFAALTAGQLQQVLSAQKKKNAMIRDFSKKLAAAKAEVISNGMFHSDFWRLKKAEMQAEHQKDLDELREGLLFYLHYAVKKDGASVGYELDYSLSVEERYAQVKAYYVEEYEDVELRFTAFDNDPIAETYLCEMYYALYDEFYLAAKA